VLCSCDYDVDKAAIALLCNLDTQLLLMEWEISNKHGKGKVRALVRGVVGRTSSTMTCE
jgi:hypothetical protein